MVSGSDEDERATRLSRRAFIKGAGAAAAVASLAGVTASSSKADKNNDAAVDAEAKIVEHLGPGATTSGLAINGVPRKLTIEPRVTLLDALRGQLGLTGTKLVCDRGACGACTVLLDGDSVTSCMLLAVDARHHAITTIEGLGDANQMHPVQQAFVEKDALQCGYCTPGMIMSIVAALRRNRDASPGDIKEATAGNICRCGTYPHVLQSAAAAARKLRGKQFQDKA